MNNTAKESYLISEVMTATPQKLQLMLIDAAIRSVQLARQHWNANEFERGGERLIHAQHIVGEILSAMDYESKSDLVRKVAGIYLFIYRTLMDAAIYQDAKKIDEALRILTIERDTWRQVCEKIAVTSDIQSPSQTNHAPLAPNPTIDDGLLSDLSTGAFSLEA
jgi:flagellar secretion chaperone FliS